MNMIKSVSGFLVAAMMTGCASMPGAQGPRGPKLVGSGQATEYGQYGEVGVEFSSVGDFVALVHPGRWKSPIKTGGSLSWMNPRAWSDDPGRTGRILLGQVVVAGGAVAAGSSGGGGGGDSGVSGGTQASTPDDRPADHPVNLPPGA